jgi:hypothetical protein
MSGCTCTGTVVDILCTACNCAGSLSCHGSVLMWLTWASGFLRICVELNCGVAYLSLDIHQLQLKFSCCIVDEQEWRQ